MIDRLRDKVIMSRFRCSTDLARHLRMVDLMPKQYKDLPKARTDMADASRLTAPERSGAMTGKICLII